MIVNSQWEYTKLIIGHKIKIINQVLRSVLLHGSCELVGLIRSRSTSLSLRYLWIQVSKLSSSSKESNPESDLNPLYYRPLSFNSWLCRVTAYMVNNLNIQELTDHSYQIDKYNIQRAIDIQKFSDIPQSHRLQNPVTKSKRIQA